MNFMRRRYIAVIFFILCSTLSAQNMIFHRSFWTPQYEGLPLSYCLIDGVTCGIKVAASYCQWLGFKGADHSVIAYNLGLTRFFQTKVKCKNWQCHGFKTIRCVGRVKDKPVTVEHYRKIHLVYPRYRGNRVDWCLNGNGKYCGKRTAFSFCRRIGYMKTIGFAPEMGVGATEAIGNQRRCFGDCVGFRYINCFR